MASILLWAELTTLARHARKRFGLPRFHLEPLIHPRVRIFGDCDVNGTHRTIRLRVHQLDGRRPLSRGVILGTLAHELAHLRHPGHGREFKTFLQEILDWMAE